MIKRSPKIDEDNCAGCSLCVENCPKECLKLSEPEYHGDIHIFAKMVNINECIGCGICAKVCPIEAITM